MNSTTPRLRTTLEIAGLVVAAAESTARSARQGWRQLTSLRRGQTIRPGPQTPLWNEVVTVVRPHLRRYGEKSKLARLLGVPPQRIHDYFGSRRATPDAERLLFLLHWLAAKRSGRDLG